MDKQVVEYEKVSMPILERASVIEIDNEEDVAEATELLSQMNQTVDKVKVEKDRILGPLKEAVKVEKARWEPLESLFKPQILRIRTLLGEYQTRKRQAELAEEEKIAARAKEGKGNLKPETAIRKMSEIDRAATKVQTESGGLSFRDKKILKITDMKAIPKKYWIVDEDAVFADLKNGIEVKGAEIEITQTVVNKR